MSLRNAKMSSLADKLYPTNEELKEKIVEVKGKKPKKEKKVKPKGRKKPSKKKKK